MNWMRRKRRVDAARERVGERGLADARHVLEQQMPARDQRLDRAAHHLGLAAQRLTRRARTSRCACAHACLQREHGLWRHGGGFGRFARGIMEPLFADRRMRARTGRVPSSAARGSSARQRPATRATKRVQVAAERVEQRGELRGVGVVGAGEREARVAEQDAAASAGGVATGELERGDPRARALPRAARALASRAGPGGSAA